MKNNLEEIKAKLGEVYQLAETQLTSYKKLGINGHPFVQQAYFNNYQSQGDIMRNMDIDAYRFDVRVDTRPELIKDLYLKTVGIEWCPMLYLAGLSLTDADQFKKGYDTAYSFCYNYAPYFKTIELGNELELKFIKPGQDGTKVEHYDLTALKAVTSYLKGMVQGVRDVGVHKITIDGTWLHFGYIQYLIDNGVEFDFLGWHWYDNQDRLRFKSTTVPIEETLFTKFGKPLIFNEVGVRNSDGNLDEQTASEYMMLLVNRLQQSPNIEKVFVYELFKQPYLGAVWEREYGIYKDSLTPTIAAESLKGVIK